MSENLASNLWDFIQFDENGLIPVITQQAVTGKVLMLAWMNKAALEETLSTGQMCYWSRSRGKLWRKGEESGQVQKLLELSIDCDGDALLASVEQTGVACHTGRAQCFFYRIDGDKLTVTLTPEKSPDELYGTKKT